ncbi:MAG: inositol monophosphatase [Candidatus Aminicenantes bacterium]|nr:inositol monophosphatase [Candidatus Aminicenantes bacterium]
MSDQPELLAAAREAALETGRMLRSALAEEVRISFKGEVDLVTQFDGRAQQMIDARLRARFPAFGILAEEGLSRDTGSPYRWIVDPIDGTTNFAHRFPVFSVSIALEKDGEGLLGVVYDPMRDEMFWAVRGGGAFLNGAPVRVSATRDVGRSLVATGFPYDLRVSPENNVRHFNNFILRVQAVRRCGSAALDLSYVACGRFDGFWELKLKPWDVAAGALIVREAGGRVSDFAGGGVPSFHSDLVATNGLIHDGMLEIIRLGEDGPAGEAPAEAGR